MPSKPSVLRSNLKRIVAGVLAIGMFLAMRRSTDRPGAPDGADVRSRFAFARTVLPDDPDPRGREARRYRFVHPAMIHMRAFFSTLGAAAALHDLDGNGLPDDLCRVDTLRDRVIVSPVPGTGDRYPAFVLDPGSLAIRDEGQVPSSCLPADLNEDGHPDLVVAYAGRSPILYTWHPAPAGAPVLSAANFSASEVLPGVVWTTLVINAVDLDGDGHLELVVANYFADGGEVFNPHATGPMELPDSFSRAFNGGGVHIFRVTPGERYKPPVFAEVADALDGIPSHGWGLALGANDIDGDLLPELYIANDFGPDRFLWNRSTPGHIRFQLIEGEPHQSIPASKVIGHDSFKSMGVDFDDLNGDGIPDLFVSNITEPLAFQESQNVFLSTGSLEGLARGAAPYVESGDTLGLGRSGWAWDSKLDDFDNDGTDEAVQATGFLQGKTSRWPELHELAMANDQIIKFARTSWPAIDTDDDIAGHDHNPFYVRVGARYVNVAEQIGFGEDYPSRGIAIADVKGNGRLDMVIANMMAPATYYENVGTRVGAFLGLHVMLPARGQTVGSPIVHDGHPAAADVAARPAIGAVATVFLPNGRRVSREVDGGNGHTGKRSPDLHFGLGAANGPLRVEIKWRDAGGIHTQSLSLTPGWHTVILASGRTS